MAEKPIECPRGHHLTWYGEFAICDGDDTLVPMEGVYRTHTGYWHWRQIPGGILNLCWCESQTRPLLAHIRAQDAELTQLAQERDDAINANMDIVGIQQEGMRLIVEQRDGAIKRLREQDARIAALEGALRRYTDTRILTIKEYWAKYPDVAGRGFPAAMEAFECAARAALGSTETTEPSE